METITCIPGSWIDRTEFLLTVAEQTNDRYLFAGNVLMNSVTKVSAKVEICPKDSRMHDAFHLAGYGKISEEDLKEIKSHRSVLYITCDIDGLSNLHILHTFINVCLISGGLGVKFENSGVSHSARQWNSYVFHKDKLSLLNAHVILAYDKKYYYSCGMHIFGLPDVAVSIDIPEASYLLTEFNHYHLFEGPNFKSGHTFSTDKESPKYNVLLREDFIYKGIELFDNPYGRIELALRA